MDGPTSTRPGRGHHGSSASLLLLSLPPSCSPASTDASPQLEPYFTGSNLPTRLPRRLLPPCLARSRFAVLLPSVTSSPRRRVAPATGLPLAPPPRAERHATRRGRARPRPDPPPAAPLPDAPPLRSRATASGAEIRPYLNRGFCSLLVSDPGLLGLDVLPCFPGSRFRSQFGSKSLVLGSVGCELLSCVLY